jgi:hypothetical protein
VQPLINIIEDCDDGKRSERSLDAVEALAVHRIGFDDWTQAQLEAASPIEIARRFIDDPEVAKYTGGELAYTLLLDHKGVWWQCLRLGDTGKHARRWSVPAIGVGVIGDFRVRPPTPVQRAALVDGLARLAHAFGIDPLGRFGAYPTVPRLAGHDELPGGSADPKKRCPGKFLPMADLRRDVALAIPRMAQAELLAAGLEL